MERLYNLRAMAAELGLNYHTIRRWCYQNRCDFSRTPTGTICFTQSQADNLLRRMVRDGNAGAASIDK